MKNKLLLITLSLLNFSVAAKPNVVFILADDMSRDTWGAYGGKECKTPNLDRLAKEGARFDRAYCSVAMCAPFRQELYSGRSPWRTGTLPNHSKSVEGTQSIVHYLKPLGYRVALLGKSHVGPNECYPFEKLGEVSKKTDANPDILAKSRSFFQDCEKKGDSFCLFIGSHDSHAPFTTGDPSAYDASKLTVPPYWVDTPELREEMVKYYAEITNFDRLVGMMRKELEKRKLWDETVFMVCSEQGTQLPFAKWTCYDNGLRTGLVMRWPGVTRPGSVVRELVSTADVTPTLVDGLGGSLDKGACDGKSFLALLKGEGSALRDYVYGAFTNCRIIANRERVFPIRTIRDKGYSLIFNPNHRSITSNLTLSQALKLKNGGGEAGEVLNTAASWVPLADDDEHAKALVEKLHRRSKYELYDLRKDPYELSNLAKKGSHAKVMNRLKSKLHAKLEELGDADPIATERNFIAQNKK